MYVCTLNTFYCTSFYLCKLFLLLLLLILLLLFLLLLLLLLSLAPTCQISHVNEDNKDIVYRVSCIVYRVSCYHYYNRNHYFSASRLDEHTEMRPNRWGKNSTNFKQGMGRKKRRTYLQSWCCFSGFFLLLHVWVFSDAPRVFGLL